MSASCYFLPSRDADPKFEWPRLKINGPKSARNGLKLVSSVPRTPLRISLFRRGTCQYRKRASNARNQKVRGGVRFFGGCGGPVPSRFSPLRADLGPFILRHGHSNRTYTYPCAIGDFDSRVAKCDHFQARCAPGRGETLRHARFTAC